MWLLLVFAFCLLTPSLSPAQSSASYQDRPFSRPDLSYSRHNLTLGVGAALPRGDLKNLFKDSPALNVSYGYRFARNLQIDAGFESVFGAADVFDFLPTAFGDLRIRDYQFLVPAGSRAILPLGDDRVLLFAGGGGALLRYTERVQQPFSNSGIRFPCRACDSRTGFAAYGLGGINVFLDQDQRWRVGMTARYFHGYTDGDSYGDVPRLRTRDRWINVLAEIGYSF